MKCQMIVRLSLIIYLTTLHLSFFISVILHQTGLTVNTTRMLSLLCHFPNVCLAAVWLRFRSPQPLPRTQMRFLCFGRTLAWQNPLLRKSLLYGDHGQQNPSRPLFYWLGDHGQQTLIQSGRTPLIETGISFSRTLVFLAEPPHVKQYIKQILFYYLGDHNWQNPCLPGRTLSCNTIHKADPLLLTWGSWLAEPFSFWQTPSCNTIHTADPFLLTWGSWLAEPLSFWQNHLM